MDDTQEQKEAVAKVLPPQEYLSLQNRIEELQKTVKSLKNENMQLKKILQNGEVCHLEDMISTFQRETKKSLKEICEEVSVTDFSTRTIDSVTNLMDYMSYVSTELYSLISVSNQGFPPYSEDLRQCEKMKEDLLGILNKNSFTSSILPGHGEAMAKALQVAMGSIIDHMEEEN